MVLSALGRNRAHPCVNGTTTRNDISPQVLHDVLGYLESKVRLEKVATRRHEAWQSFYQTYDPIIRRFAIRCRLPEADLDECSQEVWCKLLTGLSAFHCEPERGRFQSWLFTVVRNQCIDIRRRSRRCQASPMTTLIEARLVSQNDDPTAQVELAADRSLFPEMFEELRSVISVRSYRALCLRFAEGRSVREIATSLELTDAQTRLILCRAKKQLSELIKRRFKTTQYTAIDATVSKLLFGQMATVSTNEIHA